MRRLSISLAIVTGSAVSGSLIAALLRVQRAAWNDPAGVVPHAARAAALRLAREPSPSQVPK